MLFPICMKCMEETLKDYAALSHTKRKRPHFLCSKSWKIAERLYMVGILYVYNNICALFSPIVENPSHNEFVHLRNMLIRTNMQDLKHATHYVLYENYRINCLCKNPCLVNKKIIKNCLSFSTERIS